MKKLSKFLSLLLCFSLCTTAPALAAGTESTNYENKNIGISFDNPDEINNSDISLFGLSKPTTSKNLASGGIVEFEGNATGSTLYLNTYFTGKSSYDIEIVNHHSNNTLKVKMYKKGSTFAAKTWYVPSNGTLTFTTTDHYSDADYYLVFYAPSDFSGYIK